jgi:choline kinase
LNQDTQSTHVVVLAAGKGSRLSVVSPDRPKWLVEVGDEVIADRQLAGIAAASDHVASTTIVTGHGAAAIGRYLSERDADASTLFNETYETINNWYSVLLALRSLPEDARIVFMNSDLFVEPDTVSEFIRDAATTDAEALIAVDLERELTDESMKVTRRADGTLDRIGKKDVPVGDGEYIGILMARGSVLRRFRDGLAAFEGREECINEWYEGAVRDTAAAGADWLVWAVPSGRWVEIDDDDDLAKAAALVPSP